MDSCALIPHDLWEVFASWHVTMPRPLIIPRPVAMEGEGPAMPKSCLPAIRQRKFKVDPSGPGALGMCFPIATRSTSPCRATENAQKSCSNEIESKRIPRRVSTPPVNLELPLQGGYDQTHEISGDTSERTSPRCLPIPAQGSIINKVQELTSDVFQGHSAEYVRKMLLISCAGASNHSPDSNTQPPMDIHDKMSSPGRGKAQLNRCFVAGKAHEEEVEAEFLRSVFPPTYIPPLHPADVIKGKKTLVLNLHKTLVHSSLEKMTQYDFKVPAWVYSTLREVYVIKRPGLERFLKAAADRYEIIVFTASPRQYADLVIDAMDRKNYISHRLYGDSRVPSKQGWVKDLSVIGRDLTKVIAVDSSFESYPCHQANFLPIGAFVGDKGDRQLDDLLMELELVSRMNV